MSRRKWINDNEDRKRLRWRTYHESDARCYWCDVPLLFEEFTLDHIAPWSKGGSRCHRKNLAVACAACNGNKKDLDYPRSVVNPVKAWFAWVYRNTNLIERADLNGILALARSKNVQAGRGTIIVLMGQPEWARESKQREFFKCSKPPRQPIILLHGYKQKVFPTLTPEGLSDRDNFGTSLRSVLEAAGINPQESNAMSESGTLKGKM